MRVAYKVIGLFGRGGWGETNSKGFVSEFQATGIGREVARVVCGAVTGVDETELPILFQFLWVWKLIDGVEADYLIVGSSE